MNENMEKPVALVTGGSRGLGQAIVRELRQQGWRVAFTYLQNAKAADALVAELGEEDTLAIQADAKDAQRLSGAADHIVERFGRIDALVNNAGITRDQSILTMDDEDWSAVLDANLSGAFHTCKAILPRFLRQRSGAVVNMSSVAGVMGVPGQANYCASKAGLIGMTRALALECAARNIRVNAVAPGFISTDMTAGLSDKQLEAARNSIPMKRFGTAQDIAQMTAFLLSSASAYITGQVFVVDGGLST